MVKKLNPSGELRHYPGSPLLAAELCRSHDRLQLSELHPADFPRLESLFRGDRRIQIHKVDGYANLKALLPPIERRGVILIDPPYELHHEYSDVVNGVMDGLKRWGTGTFAIWYPVVQRTDVSFLERKFSAAGLPSTLQIELNVLPENNRFGMTGSGMIVVNPPWKLASTMDDLLPWLATALGQYADANYRLNWLVSEG